MPVLAPVHIEQAPKRIDQKVKPSLEEFQEVFWTLVSGLQRRLVGAHLKVDLKHRKQFVALHVTGRLAGGDSMHLAIEW